MTDVNATEVQIDTDPRETMTEAGGHGRAAEALVGGRNREHVARARNIQHTVVLNHVLPHGKEIVKETTRALIVVMVAGMAVGAQTIWKGTYRKCVF